MKTSLFDFHLPESLIATRPASPRESARLLIVPPPRGGRFASAEALAKAEGGGHVGHDLSTNAPLPPARPKPLRRGEGPASPLKGEELYDSTIAHLPNFLKPGDIMVFNDSRVIPARLWGAKGDAKIEVLLHKDKQDGSWQCFAKPAKKLKTGDTISFAEDFSATVADKLPDGQVVLNFDQSHASLREKLNAHGQMPLPPYIEKKRGADDADKRDYQTVYAAEEGSVAAPTAGLHFTAGLLKTIDALGVHRAHVTLHVGGGTFMPVKVEDTDSHVMHSEWAEISAETANAINEAKQKGGRVIAVGTTALRTLESAADANGVVQPFSAETAIFITPGYRFKAVDVLLTNFHLPKSTLFMLVAAFSGLDRMQTAYKHAIAQQYRFYSYGDACLLER